MSDVSGAIDARIQSLNKKYRLVRKIGEGGMGQVYEGVHMDIGRPVAIKVLHPHLTKNQEIVSRFQREAQSAGTLVDENIAAITDFGVADDGAPYLVMELLEGKDLAQLLVQEGPLPVTRGVYIAIQACRGLAAAHRHAIIHRDLKPENLFVSRRNDGTDLVKILDFGIAKLCTSVVLTQTGVTMGTPYYMSPEQARGAKNVDDRTDVYSLGTILYEILSGAKPHPGTTYNEILYHVLCQEPEPLESLRPNLPPGLSAVVAKAMARESGERFASVVELMEALVPFAGRSVTPPRTQVRPVTPDGATMQTPMSIAPGIVSQPSVSAFSLTPIMTSKSHAGRWGALIAVALVFAALIVVLASRRARNTDPAGLRDSIAGPAAPTTESPRPAAVPEPAPVPPAQDNPAPKPLAAQPGQAGPNTDPPQAIPPGRPPRRTGGHRPSRNPVTASPAQAGVKEGGKAESALPQTELALPKRGNKKGLVRPLDRNNPFAN